MTPPDPDPEKGIPKPPSRAEVDRISQDQALIADEWAPEPEATPAPDKARPG